jgi:hypothetical protein
MNALEDRLRSLGYDESSPMWHAMLARYQSGAEMTFTLTGVEAEKTAAWFADLAEEPDVEPVEWGCCEDPQPAILETNNRLFCRNCRRYLDRREDGGASDDD